MMFFSRQMPKISGRIDENRQKYKFPRQPLQGRADWAAADEANIDNSFPYGTCLIPL
jgi:hypothetical protein